ncbi:MAG: family 43 glycosylhydrolase [Akkermansiaceae bacterium]|nr:family 43 glycosylhydrolase [Verrucomicrobiales bacterium]
MNRYIIRLVMTAVLWLNVSLIARGELPVLGDYYAHDPSTMIKEGNRYYVFRTSPGIMGKYSTDLRNWHYSGQVFPGNPPAWTTNAVPSFGGNFWAPDIAYFNGKYHLYYSISDWATIDSAIGLVTSPSLISPTWTDQGKVIQSDATWEAGPNTDVTSFNCIDPSILLDSNGTVWMSWGSYSDGIIVMQLNPLTGKRITPNSPLTKVADSGTTFFSNGTEASSLYQRGGYYYLFINYGGCCSGLDSTYNVRVGRATSVTGPYRDRNNVLLTDGGGTMLMESTGRFIGPGHVAIMNDNGTNWLTYHYYDANNVNPGEATLGLAQLFWTGDGWPTLTNDWSALYTFDVDAREHLRQFNGTLQQGAAIAGESGRGTVLRLDGNSNYVSLPIALANASTFAAWVKWNGGGDWQRIFDFGSGTSKYLFLTPRAFNGRMRFGIRNGGAEQIIEALTALPTNSWAHVAVTLDGTRGTLYLNGNVAAISNNITIRPWEILARSNYVGESQFAADSTWNGKLDSFRVFGRALSSNEIRDFAWAHPALAHRYSFNSNTLDTIGLAHGTLNGNATVTSNSLKLTGAPGGFLNLPGGLVSGSVATTIEFWASFGVNGNWARVFDFGNISGGSGQNFLFYSPHSPPNNQHLALNTSGGGIGYDSAGTLDNRSLQVVCIVDPANSYCAIYTNGVLQSSLTTAMPPLGGVSAAWSFIGRSLFSGDAWLNATIDEFRIYDGRLTPDEITANFTAGPNALALPMTLAISNALPNLSLTWPDYGVGFVPENSSVLDSVALWSGLGSTPVLDNGRWRVTLPVLEENQFYRLRR